MSALVQLIAAGIEVKALPDGKVRAIGYLTDDMRALIRAHKPEILAELTARKPARDTLPNSVNAACAANDHAADPCAARKARALSILAEHPERRIAVVAEAGDPAHVTVAIRDCAVGELTIPAGKYDAFALLALMQHYGHA